MAFFISSKKKKKLKFVGYTVQNGFFEISFIAAKIHLRISSRQFLTTVEHVCVEVVIVIVMITGADWYMNVFHVWNRSFDSHGCMCLDVDRNGSIYWHLHRIRHFFFHWHVVETLHWIWGWNWNFYLNR